MMSATSTNIAVFGIGYVGLSNAVLLSQRNHVILVDVVPEKVELINKKESPLADKEIIEYLEHHDLDLQASTNGEEACRQAEYVIIATPTNYDTEKKSFDTSSVESVMEMVLRVNPKAYIIIKSTVTVQ